MQTRVFTIQGVFRMAARGSSLGRARINNRTNNRLRSQSCAPPVVTIFITARKEGHIGGGKTAGRYTMDRGVPGTG